MLKSLHYQSNLTTIDLSRNFLQDDSCRSLADALPTLSKLQHLNLSGNHITYTGIAALSAKLIPSSTTAPPELVSLTLSFNPLTNKCAPHLATILASLTTLRRIHLCSVDMTDMSGINFSQIVDLDISFNRLKLTDSKRILRQLNACKLTHLNVAFSAEDGGGLGAAVAHCLQAGTCDQLRVLNVAGLHLDDGDAFELVQWLRRAKQLDELHITDNGQVSAIGLQQFLQHIRVKRFYFDSPALLSSSAFGRPNLMDDLVVVGGIGCETIHMRIARTDDIERVSRWWQRLHHHGEERTNVQVRHRKVVLSCSSCSATALDQS